MQCNSQKGRSMIEMIAVLAIIGIITVGAIAGINQGFVKYRTSKTYTEIRAINQGVYGMYKYIRNYHGAGDTPNLDYEEACDSRVFPSGCDEISGGYVARNPFGGEYRVIFMKEDDDGYTQNCNKDCSFMQICADNMPLPACQELQNLNWGGYARQDGECSKTNSEKPDTDPVWQFCIYMD